MCQYILKSLLYHFPHDSPCFHKPFYTPGGVCGAGGGEGVAGTAGQGLGVFAVHFLCSFAVYEDIVYGCCIQYGGQIIDLDISNARIGRTGNLTRCDDIPDSDVMAQ